MSFYWPRTEPSDQDEAHSGASFSASVWPDTPEEDDVGEQG